MDTLEETNEKGKIKILTEETIYDTYKRVLCEECNNRYNDKDLCNIVVNINKEAQCFNYDRCMKNQCKTCKEHDKCFND